MGTIWKPTHSALLLLSLSALLVAAPLSAGVQTSSDLLLPYFVVDLENPGGLTTLFAVGNPTQEAVPIRITVYTNWGIAILQEELVLDPDQVRTVNLRDWIDGRLPGRLMQGQERGHLRAALSGQPSPLDDLYYSTEVTLGQAVGYVVIQTTGSRPDVLFGDYFIVDPSQDFAQGELLINLARGQQCQGVCFRHALRFLVGGGFDGGTQVVIWTARQGIPSADPYYPSTHQVQARATAYSEAGDVLGERPLELLPVQRVDVADLGLEEPFGWIDLEVGQDSYVGVDYSASHRYSVGFETYCLPNRAGPGIRIEKSTNGQDADAAPGPEIAVGEPVTWSYQVTNSGGLPLSGVTVTDDQGVAVSCPQSTLEPGESMTCTGHGTAVACQYRNVGTAVGTPPEGHDVHSSDPSHYFGGGAAAVDIEKSTNGHDADAAPGPELAMGAAVTWSYVVTNTGGSQLSNVLVTDDQGVAVSCPKTTLAVGESMTCTASGTAELGQYRNVGTVTAEGECGETVSDSDASHYYGTCPDDVGIDIEKATNGHDADAAPGPQLAIGYAVTWTYVVTNTGSSTLLNVAVTDDQGVAVSCPKTTLAAGESMTCTAHGTAVPGQYRNVGTATATCSCGTVADSDPSHYYGACQEQAGIDLEKATNGHDADAAPGPQLAIGDAVTWTYVVSNTGDSALSGISVVDDQGVAVSCPAASLDPGASMTCTGHGTAVAGQYRNVGTATATSACGASLSDSDLSHYHGECQEQAGIDLEKATNGHDADAAPGPELAIGDAVTWSYVVSNTGDSALSGISVVDDQGVVVSCPAASLTPGASMTCTGHGTAVAGQYRNVGTATATSACGASLSDSDLSHYWAEEPPGGQGCTPGYWKNHTDSWPPTGYSPGQSVQSVFSAAAAYPGIGSASLLEALDFNGGSGVEGGARNLLRAAVAALLDSSHPGVSYPRTPGSVIADVDVALASGDRDTMLSLASALDRDNNLGCPLN